MTALGKHTLGLLAALAAAVGLPASGSAQSFNLTGLWRDDSGSPTTYRIRQIGNRISEVSQTANYNGRIWTRVGAGSPVSAPASAPPPPPPAAAELRSSCRPPTWLVPSRSRQLYIQL